MKVYNYLYVAEQWTFIQCAMFKAEAVEILYGAVSKSIESKIQYNKISGEI